VPGSDEVDVFIVATGAEVEVAGSLCSGPILGGDRDAESRGVWVMSGESRSEKGTGSKNLLPACLITRDSWIST